MNTFMSNLADATNFTRTANGALAHASTRSAVYDMFALGGAYRQRTEADCVMLLIKALSENEELAMKCLFYLRDCRGGQGERRFFRVCYRWLCTYHPEIARRNLNQVSEYGRWDDLIVTTIDTPMWAEAMDIIREQLALDVQCKTPSLLAKWLPSENASAAETKRMGKWVRTGLNFTCREYRKTLSELRSRINIVEKLMSQNRWDEIEFDKLPSKAGLVYKNAFARRDILAKRYEAFAKSEKTTVNAKTLFPYEIVERASKTTDYWGYKFENLNEVDRLMLQKYWNNLPDYFNGKPSSIMAVVDTSGSMTDKGAAGVAPIDVAIALGMYSAERCGGPFKDHFISFSSKPQFIKVEGLDFVDKVRRIYQQNLCSNTNLERTFDLLMNAAKNANPEDVPETLVVISDMQIDRMTDYGSRWTQSNAATEMERIRKRWALNGLKMPKLVYWNVNAIKDTILDSGEGVSFVSGCSPVLFEQIIKGVSGYDLMLQKLNSERYAVIH